MPAVAMWPSQWLVATRLSPEDFRHWKPICRVLEQMWSRWCLAPRQLRQSMQKPTLLRGKQFARYFPPGRTIIHWRRAPGTSKVAPAAKFQADETQAIAACTGLLPAAGYTFTRSKGQPFSARKTPTARQEKRSLKPSVAADFSSGLSGYITSNTGLPAGTGYVLQRHHHKIRHPQDTKAMHEQAIA